MKKILSLLLVFCLCIFMLVGCGKEDEVVDTNPTANSPAESIEPTNETLTEDTTPTEEVVDDNIILNKTNVTNRKLMLAITDVVKSLLAKNPEYNTYMYYPKDAFVTDADVEYILSHKDLDILNTYKFEELAVLKLAEKDANKHYEIELIGNDNSTYKMALHIDEDGQYKLDISDFFATDVSFLVPSLTTVVLDGVEVSENYLLKVQDNVSIYKFAGLVTKPHTVEYDTLILEDLMCQFDVTAETTGTQIDASYNLESVEADLYLEAAKNLYQNLVKAMVEQKTVEAIQDYFVEGYSEELLNKYIEDPAKALNIWQGYPIVNKISYRNDIDSVIIGTDTVQVNFKYELTFDGYSATGTEKIGLTTSSIASMTIESSDNLTWKIVEIDSKLLLEALDSWTSEWDKY